MLQTCVADCSFVSSLCIAVEYEKATKRKIVTGNIWPQNHAGVPIYNPSGKYMVKLFFNGVARKVIVDDFLPVDSGERLLCSSSTDPNELWISIVEKAYMKVRE